MQRYSLHSSQYPTASSCSLSSQDVQYQIFGRIGPALFSCSTISKSEFFMKSTGSFAASGISWFIRQRGQDIDSFLRIWLKQARQKECWQGSNRGFFTTSKHTAQAIRSDIFSKVGAGCCILLLCHFAYVSFFEEAGRIGHAFLVLLYNVTSIE